MQIQLKQLFKKSELIYQVLTVKQWGYFTLKNKLEEPVEISSVKTGNS